jgi:hypothetical protein
MKRTYWAGVAALAGMALGAQAHAATMPITFSGPGVSGSLEITFGPISRPLFVSEKVPLTPVISKAFEYFASVPLPLLRSRQISLRRTISANSRSRRACPS